MKMFFIKLINIKDKIYKFIFYLCTYKMKQMSL